VRDAAVVAALLVLILARILPLILTLVLALVLTRLRRLFLLVFVSLLIFVGLLLASRRLFRSLCVLLVVLGLRVVRLRRRRLVLLDGG
ncbi:MAG TPA: hypothetical protein VIY53_15620, partial [Acidobacteriaceae bacterium]